MRSWKPLAVLVVVVAIAGASGATASDERSSAPTTRLALDGVWFNPELARTPSSRSLGLMHRRKAPADGMLFVFAGDTTGGFWMKNTLVPLTIAFFDAEGVRVRKLSMTPCRRDPCPIYTPGRRYRYALELRARDPRPARRLGPLWKLERLSRDAS